jgi:hypothetical protein
VELTERKLSLSKATSRNARSGRALFLPLWFSHLPLYRLYVAAGFVLLCFHVQPALAGEPIELHSDTHIASAGYYQLRWHWPAATADTQYVLQETSTAGDERIQRDIYSGTDLASVISGKADGVYEYTVRALDGQQRLVAHSERVQVIVEHHSLARALGFFIVGLIVFVATLAVILRGAARHKQE